MTKKKEKVIEGEYIPNPNKVSKYDPSMCEKIVEVAKNGGHVAKMLVELDISRDTFYRWVKEYPEFGQAYEKSKRESQAVYEDIGLQGMLGQIKGFNYNSWVTVMNNKFPEDYKRSATGNNTEVNIGSITQNTIKSLTNEELDKKLEYLQERIKLGSDESE